MDACMFVIARSVYRNRWPLVIAWGVVTFFLTPPALYLVLRKTAAGLLLVTKGYWVCAATGATRGGRSLERTFAAFAQIHPF